MTLLPTIASDGPGMARVMDRSTRFSAEVEAQVAAIVEAVRTRGDRALGDYTARFDRRLPGKSGSYELEHDEWERRAAAVEPRVTAALEQAAERVRWFHEQQREPGLDVRRGGVRLGWRITPLAKVGLYVPGGTALYPSSVIMTAVPAKVAGVGEVVMVTPGASAETLAAARLAGVDRVFEIGGAQAIAALAYGTATVPRVDKIVGPGNQWVAAAKRIVFGQVDIDSVAGPSEVLIIADDHADPRWVAADLIAQAEHDVEARPILVTTSEALAEAVRAALEAQLATLPRATIARTSLERHGAAILVRSLDEAIDVANAYAPEHLELDVEGAAALVPRLTAAGAIFVGRWASEATGDYLAGANHVLPTGGAARYASALGVHDFVRRTSIVEYDEAAARADAPAIATLAAVEGLHGHGRSALARLGVDPATADVDAYQRGDGGAGDGR